MIFQVDLPQEWDWGNGMSKPWGPATCRCWLHILEGHVTLGSPFLLPSSGFPGMLQLRARKGSFESLAP